MGGGTMQTYLALAARHRENVLAEEAAELKRARIMNGTEPGYQNGEPYKKQRRTKKPK